MLTLLRYVRSIPALVVIVQAAVAFVEGVKANDPGADKKKAVMDSLKDGWDALASEFKIGHPFDELSPVISVLIDLAVAIYNMVGYFQRKAGPPAG